MANILICVGSDYKGTQNELSGCINDIRDLSNILGDFETTILTDAVDLHCPGKILGLPTKNNILSHWQKALSHAKPGDNVIFYYSGHGTRMTDQGGTVIDCIVPLDGAISNLEHDHLITSYDLHQLLIQTPEKVKVLFLTDTCFSAIEQLQTQTNCVLLNQTEPFIHLRMQLENTNTPSSSEMCHGKITLIAGCKAPKGSARLGNAALTNALIAWIKRNSVETFLSDCWDYTEEGLPNLKAALTATIKGNWVTQHDLQVSFVEDTSAIPTLAPIPLLVTPELSELPERPLLWEEIWEFLGPYFLKERGQNTNFSNIIQWLLEKHNLYTQEKKYPLELSDVLEENENTTPLDEFPFKKPFNLNEFLCDQVVKPLTPILDSKMMSYQTEQNDPKKHDEKNAKRRKIL